MFSTWQVLQIIDIVSEANTEPEKLKISEKKMSRHFRWICDAFSTMTR